MLRYSQYIGVTANEHNTKIFCYNWRQSIYCLSRNQLLNTWTYSTWTAPRQAHSFTKLIFKLLTIIFIEVNLFIIGTLIGQFKTIKKQNSLNKIKLFSFRFSSSWIKNETKSNMNRGTKALEMWCRRQIEGYPGVHISNMTTSWKNGMAFCAMVHHFRPDLM